MQNEKIDQLFTNEVTLNKIADALELTDDELEVVSGGWGRGGYGGGYGRRLRKRIVISYFGRGYSCGY
jgi:hypothetical protein